MEFNLPESDARRATLILAPTGRDARLAADTLQRFGFASEVCPDMATLCSKMNCDAESAILAEESLSPMALQQLHAALRAQEPWSDIPIILLTSGQQSVVARERLGTTLQVLANAVILERPIRAITLITAVKNASRARRRQHDVRHILEERSAREQEARNTTRVLQQFMGIVSHDLRNPISAIVISCEALLRRHDLNEKQGRGVDRISKAALRANKMIYDLLDFTRARLGGGMVLRVENCNFLLFTQEVVDEIATAQPDRHLKIQHTGSHLCGQWDPARMSQVVQNLVTNALAYSTGDTTVTVSIDASDQDELRLSVHNFGAVIAESQKQRIFEPLERGITGEESSLHGLDTGNIGLGLYIVKQVVAAHSGKVAVESLSEIGTTFTVRLPTVTHNF